MSSFSPSCENDSYVVAIFCANLWKHNAEQTGYIPPIVDVGNTFLQGSLKSVVCFNYISIADISIFIDIWHGYIKRVKCGVYTISFMFAMLKVCHEA